MLRDDLKVELAAVDAALADLKTRVGAARDDAKDSMKQQLAALETRELELQAQVKQTEALVGAETEKARLGIHRAIVDLSMDVTQLAYRLSH